MPFVFNILEGDTGRVSGEDDRGGFVDCRRPVAPADIVLVDSGFLAAADMIAWSVVQVKLASMMLLKNASSLES